MESTIIFEAKKLLCDKCHGLSVNDSHLALMYHVVVRMRGFVDDRSHFERVSWSRPREYEFVRTSIIVCKHPSGGESLRNRNKPGGHSTLHIHQVAGRKSATKKIEPYSMVDICAQYEHHGLLSGV